MLQELVIHDFAIIDHLELSFDSGMTALTGETGAGKSIIIDAVGLLAGGRGNSDFVRTGTDKARLQGQFSINDNARTAALLEEYGITSDGASVLLQRDLHKNGRNVCRVNGQLVNTTTLKAIGETLVDIHGQNEHQQLMHEANHLGMLDQFAKDEIGPQLAKYTELYERYVADQKQLAHKQANEQEWAQRLDMLRFQVDEISSAQLEANEEEALVVERDRLANYQKIAAAFALSLGVLDSPESNPIDAIGTARTAIQEISDYDEAYAAIAQNLDTVYYGLQDAQAELNQIVDGLDGDEERLNEVIARLDLLQQLKHKYGPSVEAVIAYGKQAASELSSMQGDVDDSDGLEARVEAEKKELMKLALLLHETRENTALKLANAVHAQLADLYMDKTVFSVRFERSETLLASGIDGVTFYIQTNPGEGAKPLARIASGGELSRLMLALKTIFAKSDGVTSIIFDEVDTGVSGRVAQAIATKIRAIGHDSQVLCITHLPQVAAMADHEFVIEKSVAGERTTTTVTPLGEQARVEEIARMLAGQEVTELTIAHAKELLVAARAEQEK